MTDLDRQIEEALDAEDRAMFTEFGEQGLLAQGLSVYRGKQGWIALVTTAVMLVLAAAAIFSAWKYFQLGDDIAALKWGAASVLLVFMISFIKVWFWMRMESNRVIREIKRVELQLARLQMK